MDNEPARMLWAWFLVVWTAFPLHPAYRHLPGQTRATDLVLRRRVNGAILRYLKPYVHLEGLMTRTTRRLSHELFRNPPVRVPVYRMQCGNSLIGYVDPVRTRATIRELFALYGVQLKPNVWIRAGSYRICADGFDQRLQVGYKLVPPTGRDEVFRHPRDLSPLSAASKEALDGAIGRGELNLLVLSTENYADLDGALRPSAALLMASVADYLDWLRGSTEFNDSEVPGLASPPPRSADHQP